MGLFLTILSDRRRLPTGVSFTASRLKCQHLAEPSRLSLRWICALSHILVLVDEAGNTSAAVIGFLLAYSNIKTPWQIWSVAFSNKITTTTLLYCNPLRCQPWVKIQGFSLGDKKVSSNSPHVPPPPGRHWITLKRILHGMKGEKDVQPWWLPAMKAHTGKMKGMKCKGNEGNKIECLYDPSNKNP